MLLVSSAHAGVWAHYSFDTDCSDVSGNARNGTLTDVGTTGNSGIITTPGDFKFGNGAINFSADRDYVAIPSKTFSSGTAYTIAFWARKTAGDTGQAADWDMAIGQRDTSTFFIALSDVTGSGLRWRGNSSATDRQADFTVTKDYTWHHYAVVASGTTITLYVDGVFSSSATGKQTGFTVDTIGEAYLAANDFDFNGQMDEVWIYDEALGASAVNALFQFNDSNATPAYTGFHHRYDGNFTDSTSAGNGGTPQGSAGITSDPSLTVAGSGALALDGADGSFVTLPTVGTYSATQPWSIAWWARRQSLGTDKGMVIGRGDNTADFIWLNDSFTGLRFRSSSSGTLDFTVAKDMNLHHYALVADGAGHLTLYVDGQQGQTLNGNTAFALDSIGKAYPTTSLHYNFQGTLDEIHVTPSAMDAAQVLSLYQQEKPPATPDALVTRVRVVLIGGQSNADGRAAVGSLPASLQSPQSDVDLYCRAGSGSPVFTTLRPGLSGTSQFGPEVVLGRRLADLYAHESGTRVAIIKYARGGTTLSTQWKAGGDATTTGDGPDYVSFQQTVTEGRAALAAKYPSATLELDSMVWMQGESDAVPGLAALYQTNLTNFIADVRVTYDAALPFIIGRLSSQQTSLDAVSLATVRAAQDAVAAADPRTGVFSTDAFAVNGDNLHFGAAGQQSLGSAFADDAIYYRWMIETFGAADIDAGRTEPDADFDGDGQTNRSEFLGASNPMSALSRFSASVLVNNATAGTVSYTSLSSRLYAVERFAEGTGSWETVLSYSQGQDGQTTRPLTLSGSRGIFRVTTKLP
ncbi:LamG-like jellyroll fold domain-containing protein [Luteolibacter sp. LG18]|uniref:LamG-like jellyroll fold domain-containing protein n=1 Tax=Luteolibacter sp. LG18 TaxID=2819286 RepID=UPI002B2E7AA2|nr:hypothetical protein llg_17490 [Luteolibacter sp. LG18]